MYSNSPWNKKQAITRTRRGLYLCIQLERSSVACSIKPRTDTEPAVGCIEDETRWYKVYRARKPIQRHVLELKSPMFFQCKGMASISEAIIRIIFCFIVSIYTRIREFREIQIPRKAGVAVLFIVIWKLDDDNNLFYGHPNILQAQLADLCF